MNANIPFLTLNKDCPEAVEWFSITLVQAGFRVKQTFDLQTARSAHALCSCPHHGTLACDCQMVILLVYELNGPPASIVAHGQDGQTWFLLVPSTPRKANPRFETRLLDTLASTIGSLKSNEWSFAG